MVAAMKRVDQLCEVMDRQWTQGEVGGDEWAGTAIELLKILAGKVGDLTERVRSLEAGSRQAADADDAGTLDGVTATETRNLAAFLAVILIALNEIHDFEELRNLQAELMAELESVEVGTAEHTHILKITNELAITMLTAFEDRTLGQAVRRVLENGTGLADTLNPVERMESGESLRIE